MRASSLDWSYRDRKKWTTRSTKATFTLEEVRMEQVRNLVEGFIVGSPYGKHLGIVTEAIEPDRVRLRLPYRDAMTTVADMVHGGAIASLVDVTATAACWASPTVDPSA